MSPQITTYSGKFFDITHPDPTSICIEDIAHACPSSVGATAM